MERAVGTSPEVDLDELLAHTSRTFALAIPLLPAPASGDVTLAYLLLRIADTLEDAERLSAAERVAALDELSQVMQLRDIGAARRFAKHWSAKRPTDDVWCQRLLSHAGDVVRSAAQLDEQVSGLVFVHCRRVMQGMAQFAAASSDGPVRLDSLADLRRYCYFVAGIVGELLTDVFRARIDSALPFEALRQRAPYFGEGLQLINMLRDSDGDAREGRQFLPPAVDRRQIAQLAREDLEIAESYVAALRDADVEPGYVAFTSLPLQLAWRTLELVEQQGPGAKVPRHELARMLSQIKEPG